MISRKLLIPVFALILLFFLHLASQFFIFFQIPLVKKSEITSIKVYPNQGIQTVSVQLREQHLITNASFFSWMFEMMDRHLRFGEYEIKYPMTAYTLLKNMVHGVGFVKHKITIVEGWTFFDVRTALSRDINLSQTITGQSGEDVLKSLHAPEDHPEGLFYPSTYFFTWNNTDLSVLKTAYKKMQMVLNADWANRAPNLPYQNAYQALIVASLIEKETAVSAEKPLIASVIVNRLAKHMRLQIDPTVMYGDHQNFSTPITQKELNTKTPYNTYLIDGLPPTPICMPSQSSIYAALHPATTDYLYYVANGKGGHNFSATYATHLEQVQTYRNGMSGSVSVSSNTNTSVSTNQHN